jgi:hypothetical protein
MKKGIGSIALVFLLVFAVAAAVPSSALAVGGGGVDFQVDGVKSKIGTGDDTFSGGQRSLVYYDGDAGYGPSYFAVWQGYTDNSTTIMFAEGWDTGRNWGPDVTVAGSTNYTGAGQAIAVIGDPNGQAPNIKPLITVLWKEKDEFNVHNVMIANSINYGGSWNIMGPVNDVAVTSSSGQNASLAVDSAGNIYVAWFANADNDMYVSSSTDGGANWNVTKVSSIYTGGTGSSIDVDPSGNVYVTWTGYPNTLYFAKSTDGGASWIYSPIASSQMKSTSMDVVDENNIYIALGDGGVYCHYTNNGGQSWSVAEVEASGSYLEPSIIVGSNGDVNVSWDIGGNVYFARKQLKKSSFGDPVLVYGGGVYTNLAVDADNKVGIMFIESWGSMGGVVSFSKEQ